MTTRPVGHPSVQILQAFGVGKLDDAAANSVMSHLDTCADCRAALAAQTDDGFLQRLRAAQQRDGTPAPDQGLSGLSRSLRGGGAPPGMSDSSTVPAELLNHPQYEVVRKLGKGGMGVVYLARNKLMDRPEVLKVVNQELLERPGSAERFLQEIRSAARLNHPNVVAAYSALQLGQLLVLAMEYVDGEDLAALVKAAAKAGKPLAVANACYYAQQAALGLQHAFEKGMVHRDIKPGNLILSRQGKRHVVEILDFGLAKVAREKGIDGGLTGTGQMMGTPDYIAPEQTLDAASADIRADIYSLGCTLYYLLTGSPPFKGRSLYEILQSHHSVSATPLNLVRPEVPVELAAVVGKMMAKDAAKRYQKPVEVAQALAPFVKPDAKAAARSSAELSVEKAKPAPLPVDEGKRRPSTPPKEEAAKVAPTTQVGPAAAVWETLTESGKSPAAPPRRKSRRKPQSGGPRIAPKKLALIGGGAAACLLLVLLVGLGVMWAVGRLTVPTPDGTIVLENLPPDADVTVDGGTVTVKSGDGKTFEVRIEPGKKHRLEVKKDGFKVFGEEVELDAGGRKSVVVRLERVVEQVKPPPDAPLGMKFVHLPKATFYMGGGDGKAGTKTEIKEDFEIAVYAVTQEQWAALMGGENPSKFRWGGENAVDVKDISDEDLKQFPVESVSWDMVQDFIKKLNEREKGKGWVYRLPKEAEWEYACRGGATSEAECSFDFYFNKPSNDLSSLQANFDGDHAAGNGPKGQYLERPTKVGSYQPNKLGLYDMHGNVWQWCDDLYEVGASGRVVRGGSWGSTGTFCRAASRGRREPFGRNYVVGFRLARVASSGKQADATPGAPPPSSLPQTQTVNLGGGVKMEFVLIDPKAKPDGGKFRMGSPPEEKDRNYIERRFDAEKQHKVEITKPFYLAKYPVTQEQYKAVMGRNPSWFSASGGGNNMVAGLDTKQFPVEGVSWKDAEDCCKEMMEKCGAQIPAALKQTNYRFALPTEAQWEYACRGGSNTAYFFDDDPMNLGEYAWFGENSGSRTHPVGAKKPNEWGLYDMCGNVSQWCADWYGEYPNEAVTDPQGPTTGSTHVYRGGCWYDKGPRFCRSADRSTVVSGSRTSYVGFRLAFSPEQDEAMKMGADKPTPPVPQVADKDGFKPLFNGKDLAGWKVNDGGRLDKWDAKDGILYAVDGGGGWLMTEKQYGDFEIRLDYKVAQRGNSGVALRSLMSGDPAFVGMEIQILDDAGYLNLNPAQYTGAIYDVVPPSRRVTKPAGEWQPMRIVAKGRQVTVEVNGTKVVDANLDDYKHDFEKHPGLKREKGYVGLQSHTGLVEFRNIEIKEMNNTVPVILIETSLGAVKVELNEQKAPITVKNFLGYVDERFYDGTLFHRVVPKLVIQGGGMEPGLKEKTTKDPIANEASNGLANERGTIAMAHTNDPHSATSQFFINVRDNPGFDKSGKSAGYCVFGKVVEGMDVVDKINAVAIENRGKHQNCPITDVVIKSIRKIENKELPGK